MESIKVKELRKRYGLMDNRNEYTENQLVELSKKKLYYIKPYKDISTGNIYIEYTQVSGYVSNDEKSSIWIKDINITKYDDKYYYPIKSIRDCVEVKKGIYHEKVDDIIFCTTDELNFCLEYEQKYIEENIREEIEELENEILQLKNAKIEHKKA